MAGIFVLCVLGLGLVTGQQHGHAGNTHGTGGHVPDSGQVDAAIVNIELHYNDKLCLELLLVDCNTHVTVGDEKVCASNGVTYENHCRFTHAMCEYLHNDNPISITNHGACVVTSAPVATNAPATNAPGASTMAPVATNAPAGSSMAPIVTDAPTTVMPVVTTTPVPTTTNSINSILQNVFCQNAGSISCASGFQIICGTDGQLYPNECELSKAKCNNPSLTIADNSKCALP